MTGSTMRVSVVTGGRGIGAACTSELARNGDLVAKE
jgi:NAD(P)-dependent dehydrogenase (short-subunit alcohol dehydrogenase family)